VNPLAQDHLLFVVGLNFDELGIFVFELCFFVCTLMGVWPVKQTDKHNVQDANDEPRQNGLPVAFSKIIRSERRNISGEINDGHVHSCQDCNEPAALDFVLLPSPLEFGVFKRLKKPVNLHYYQRSIIIINI
jgi:hypothetical protein